MTHQAQEAINYLRSVHIAPESLMYSSNVYDVETFKEELESWIVSMKEDIEHWDYCIDAYQELLVYYKEAYVIFEAEEAGEY